MKSLQAWMKRVIQVYKEEVVNLEVEKGKEQDIAYLRGKIDAYENVLRLMEDEEV